METSNSQQSLPLTRATREVRRLTVSERYKLIGFVEKEYVESKMTDVDFAIRAGEFLKIPGVNARHIGTCREAVGIAGNTAAKREDMKVSADPTRLDLHDKRITSLEAQVRKLFAGYNVDRAPTDEQISLVWRRICAENAEMQYGDLVVLLVRAILRGEWK